MKLDKMVNYNYHLSHLKRHLIGLQIKGLRRKVNTILEGSGFIVKHNTIGHWRGGKLERINFIIILRSGEGFARSKTKILCSQINRGLNHRVFRVAPHYFKQGEDLDRLIIQDQLNIFPNEIERYLTQ